MPRGRPPKDRSREEAVNARREQVRKNVQAFRERKRFQQQQRKEASPGEGESTPKNDDEDNLKDIVSRLRINDEESLDDGIDEYPVMGDFHHANVVTSPAMERSLALSTRLPPEISSASQDRQQFVTFCVAKFNPDSPPNTSPHWTKTLPEIVNKDSVLDFSIQAICLMQVGNMAGHRWLVEEGSNHYGKALRTLTRRLSIKKNLQEEIFLAMMAMSVYELSSSTGKTDEGWLFHYRAAFRYLKQLSQANSHSISDSQPVFHFLETLCVFDALGSRKSSFFSTLDVWSRSLDRWGGETYGPLLRLTTKVPALLEAHDTFLLSPNATTVTSSISSRSALLNECFRLEDDFLKWHHHTTSQLPNFSFTTEPSLGGTQQLKFSDLFTARLHLLYWSALVLLLDTASSLFKSLRPNNTNNTTPPFSTTLTLQPPPSKPPTYALWIQQSVPFCLNPENGTVGRSLLLLPLWIAQNHYRDTGESEKMKQCKDILAALGQQDLCFGGGEEEGEGMGMGGGVMGVHWKAGGMVFFDLGRKGRANLGAYSL